MTKVINNKAFKSAVAFALSAILVIGLLPHFKPAYGKDEVAAPEEAAVATLDAQDKAQDEAQDAAQDANQDVKQDEQQDANKPAEGDEAGAPAATPAGVESENTQTGETNANGSNDLKLDVGGIMRTSLEENSIAKTPQNNDEGEDDGIDAQATEGDVTISANTTENFVFNDGKTHYMTVNAGVTLTGTIKVTNGSKLYLNGGGTIQAPAGYKGSVIEVQGFNQYKWGAAVKTTELHLCENETLGKLRITGGNGGTLLNNTNFNVRAADVIKSPASNNIYNLAYDDKGNAEFRGGGAIIVQRDVKATGNGVNPWDYTSPAALYMHDGIIDGNTAQAGGGIFIDNDCIFKMDNGTVSNNTATNYEGGGIFVAGKSNGKDAYCEIIKGEIYGNKTETWYSLGGGGIFIESNGHLKIGVPRVSANTAVGLGGGVAGCPHAYIGIGPIFGDETTSPAVYGNFASKNESGWPRNDSLNSLMVASAFNKDVKIESGDKFARNDPKFTAELAKDYYCVKGSTIFGTDLGQEATTAWIGYQAGPTLTPGSVSVEKFDTINIFDATLGLTNTYQAKYDANGSEVDPMHRDVNIYNNTSTTHGGGIGCNGGLTLGDLPNEDTYSPFGFDITKNVVNNAETPDQLGVTEGEYTFKLFAEDKKTELQSKTNDADGVVHFDIKDSKQYLQGNHGDERSITFYIQEVRGDNPDMTYDGADADADMPMHKVVINYTIKAEKSVNYKGGKVVTNYSMTDREITFDDDEEELTIVNTLNLKGSWQPSLLKHYFGDVADAEGRFSFTLQGIDDPGQKAEDAAISTLVRTEGEASTTVDDGTSPFKLQATNGVFGEDDLEADTASVLFDKITYTNPGTYYYLVTEDGGADPTAYVVGVTLGLADDYRSYVVKSVSVSFAANVDETVLTPLGEGEDTIEFFNTDETLGAYNFMGLAVYGDSGESAEQKCFVDPKIIKKLVSADGESGRLLKPNEFGFKLIQVNDYNDTTGTLISEATNDENGMVDFDKANNRAPLGMDPSCLEYDHEGTYFYRVIEDDSYQKQPGIAYSTEVITFTTVIERNADTGALECTDMYYGKLVNGENVRFTASNIPAGEEFGANWHPSITNYALGMDLRVKKTSVEDRETGLANATYGLYMVSDGAQGDVFMDEQTSDADGWIYYENVDLKENTLYYFQEIAAPDGYTVSQFRSKYFYLEADMTAPNGYVMKYTDSKFIPGGEVEAAPLAEVADKADDEVTGETPKPEYGRDGQRLLMTYAEDGGVSDEQTDISFSKLDTNTHEWVENAELSIINKETGEVVNAWVSGKAPERLQGKLVAGQTYILREDNAPEGFKKANDVEFTLDQYGNVEIISGTENGNAELQGSTINLYDTALDVVQNITEERVTTEEVPGEDENIITTVTRMVQTGDLLPVMALMVAAIASLGIVALAARRARRQRRF